MKTDNFQRHEIITKPVFETLHRCRLSVYREFLLGIEIVR